MSSRVRQVWQICPKLCPPPHHQQRLYETAIIFLCLPNTDSHYTNRPSMNRGRYAQGRPASAGRQPALLQAISKARATCHIRCGQSEAVLFLGWQQWCIYTVAEGRGLANKFGSDPACLCNSNLLFSICRV